MVGLKNGRSRAAIETQRLDNSEKGQSEVTYRKGNLELAVVYPCLDKIENRLDGE